MSAGVSSWSVADRPAALRERVSDYLALTKPKISLLVLVTVAVSMFLAGWGPPAPWILLQTLVGAALVAASASAMNQWLERDADALMPRTLARPLPQGRLSGRHVCLLAIGAGVAGVALLAVGVNGFAAGVATAIWFTYVCVYTPMKRRTPANTAVGAVAGALPVLLGYAAAGRAPDLVAWSLTLVVYLWQFPHFMAIAWIYRRQYTAAGMKMLTTVDPTGRRAAAQGVIAALLLIPISLVVPVSLAPATRLHEWVCFLGALTLGAIQLAIATWFLCRRDDASARGLLRMSLVYLPLLLVFLLAGPFL